MLLFLCGGLHLSHGEKLKCKFQVLSYDVGETLYSCELSSLENSNNSMIIDGYTGDHIANKNDNDVMGLYIHNTNANYIPANLGMFFNLKVLYIQNSQLIKITSKDFQGMQNLEHLSLYGNKLVSVPTDAFSTLTKLRQIHLNNNQIQYIGCGLVTDFDPLYSNT